MTSRYNELLWIFTQLPNDCLVLDTETTGLPDESGLPDIVTLGITVVRNRETAESIEFETRPQRRISEEAQAINLPCGHRGPSLDTLTKALGVEDLRAKGGGIHGAKVDSWQSAHVVEVMRQYGNRTYV